MCVTNYELALVLNRWPFEAVCRNSLTLRVLGTTVPTILVKQICYVLSRVVQKTTNELNTSYGFLFGPDLLRVISKQPNFLSEVIGSGILNKTFHIWSRYLY